MPNGVSVSVQKEDGKPAEVTVKRGEETWKSPATIRNRSSNCRKICGRSSSRCCTAASPMGMNFNMPDFDGLRGRGIEDGRLRDRLDEMEQRMNRLFERLGENPPVIEPKAEQEEAQ